MEIGARVGNYIFLFICQLISPLFLEVVMIIVLLKYMLFFDIEQRAVFIHVLLYNIHRKLYQNKSLFGGSLGGHE